MSILGKVRILLAGAVCLGFLSPSPEATATSIGLCDDLDSSLTALFQMCEDYRASHPGSYWDNDLWLYNCYSSLCAAERTFEKYCGNGLHPDLDPCEARMRFMPRAPSLNSTK